MPAWSRSPSARTVPTRIRILPSGCHRPPRCTAGTSRSRWQGKLRWSLATDEAEMAALHDTAGGCPVQMVTYETRCITTVPALLPRAAGPIRVRTPAVLGCLGDRWSNHLFCSVRPLSAPGDPGVQLPPLPRAGVRPVPARPSTPARSTLIVEGSSPQARGRPRHGQLVRVPARATPAGAGTTGATPADAGTTAVLLMPRLVAEWGDEEAAGWVWPLVAGPHGMFPSAAAFRPRRGGSGPGRCLG